MNRLRAAAILCAAFATVASAPAADRATPPPAASAADWAGFYGGGFGGGSLADARGGYSISSPTLAALPPIIPVIDALGSRSLSLHGASFGLDAGYNWPVGSQFLLGLEGDVRQSGLHGRQESDGIIPNFGVPYTITQALDVDWEASLRLRAGVTPFDDWLVYVTGGPAVAHLHYATAFWDPVPEIENKSFSAFRAGWVVGAGAEWALSRKWSLKTEYSYAQFSSATGTGSGLLADGTTAYIAHSTGVVRENSLRFGVNYHFD